MSAPALTVARNYLSAYNRHDSESLAAQYAQGGVQTLITGEKVEGRQAIQAYFTGLFTAFPDLKISPKQTFATSATSFAAEAVMEGTHLGPLVTGAQTIPATGRAIRLPMVFSATVNPEGLITAAAATGDAYRVLLQLGQAPLRTTEDQRIGTVRKLMKAATTGDLEGIMACYAPLAQFGDGDTGSLDRQEIRELWSRRLAAFPNGIKVTEKEIGLDGPTVLVRMVMEGSFTHGGSPGKQIAVEAVEIFTIGVDGIFSHRTYLDNSVFYKALGLLQ